MVPKLGLQHLVPWQYGWLPWAIPLHLYNEPVSEASNWVSERMIFIERGAFGWDGPDGCGGACKNTNYNHSRGYNAVYFDGHAKSVVFGKKWNTVPATGWGPDRSP
jgi:prepilin-type processing-associated H-X9-DG protein